MTPSERLLDRLHAMGLPIQYDYRIERTRAGRTMLAAGSWSWRVVDASGQPFLPGGMIGSIEPITKLAKAPRLSAARDPRSGDIDVHAGPPDTKAGWKTWTEPNDT